MNDATLSTNLFENLRLELRRGALVLAVLAALRGEQYGYTLRVALSRRGLEVDENTLYPLLRRLESQGLLSSVWREENKRKKRFYRLTAEGEQMLARLMVEWRAIGASIDEVVHGGQEDGNGDA
jgi:DNA-binding PadR family transcriptional regulator